jgi:hypothetical protein
MPAWGDLPRSDRTQRIKWSISKLGADGPRIQQMREKGETSSVQVTRKTRSIALAMTATHQAPTLRRWRPHGSRRGRDVGAVDSSHLADDRRGAAVGRRRPARAVIAGSRRVRRRSVNEISRVVPFLPVPLQADQPSEGEAWIRNKPWTGGDHGPRTKKARVDPARAVRG